MTLEKGVYHGNGWRYVPQNSTREDRDTLYLDGDSFDLSDAFIRCHVIISNKTTVKNTNFGCYENPSGDAKITNSGFLQNCEFFDSIIINNNRIGTSIFENCNITNSGNFNDCLFALKGTDSFFFSSMSASNSFSSLSLENSISSPSFSGSGKYTDCLFNFDPSGAGLSGVTVHTLQRADQNKLYAFLANYPDNFTAYSAPCFYTVGSPKIKTVYIDSDQVYYYNVRFINGIPSASYDSEFYHDNVRWYVFTVQDGDAVLMSDAKELTIDSSTGKPDTTGMTSYNGVYYGNGWKYENGTLTLESGSYDFSTTKPTTKDGDVLKLVNCKVVVENGATITGGHFRAMSNYGTVENSLLSNNTIENCDGGTMTNCLFCRTTPPVGVANYHKLTEVNNNVFDVTLPNASDIFSGWTTYYFTGTPTLVVCLAVYGGFNKLNYINGDEHYGNLTGPDSYGYYTFTPPEEEDIVLNREPYATDLVMTPGGIPDITNVAGGKDGTHFSYKGDGWTFTGAADISDAIGTLTLKNTNSYDFSCLDPLKGTGGELAAVKCPLINDGATIKDGVFKNLVINHSGTISGGTFAVDLASINSEDFSTSGTVTGGAFNGKDGLSDGAHAVTVNGGSIRKVNDTEPLKAYEINDAYGLRYGIVPSAEWNLYSYEGTIVTVTADTDITNINGWDIGKFPASSYLNGADDKKTVRFQMPDGPVVLNATLYTLEIIRGTMMGNTSVSAPAGTELKLDADEPAKNETFLGWTLSDKSLLTKGTLNDPECTRITIKMNNASATAEAVFQKDTPAYTLTVTGGGLVNGKTSALVEAGDEVCLTVGEMQEGMSFNYWDLPTALIKALTDSSSGGFSNKVEPLTFTMPDLSEYTEDTRFTIRLDIRPAELPDDDDGPSVLGTMATVAVGGAAAGILVWQGVSLGVDSYLQLSLPGGVPVPTNRRELVKLLWETAGKPDVVLPALYGDVSAEDGELQKATRWAIDNGLVKPADEGDASRFDPDRSVSKYEVARAWFKVQQMLK